MFVTAGDGYVWGSFPRVPPVGLHPRLYRLVAVGDKKLDICPLMRGRCCHEENLSHILVKRLYFSYRD